MKKLSTLFTMALVAISLNAQPLRVISYNVENLFDTQHAEGKQDIEFTPDGAKHWTYERYKQKCINLSRVITSIGEGEAPALIGLCEVENVKCIRDMLIYGNLRKFGYQYVHEESPDMRGIDCALLYNVNVCRLLEAEAIPVPMPENERPTRDIIYTKMLIHQKDTMHVMVCHLPSQLGGTEATQHKRVIAHAVLQQIVDKILNEDANAKIIIMGDFNSKPTNTMRGVQNLMMPFEAAGKGSHKWEGVWSCLDQFYVSDALINNVDAHIYDADWLMQDDTRYMGKEPKRCYTGPQWTDGYSDHLPIYMNVNLK